MRPANALRTQVRQPTLAAVRCLRYCSKSAVFLLVVRCSSPPTDMSLTTAVMFGSVKDASGAPVANAHVSIDTFLQGCGVGSPWLSMGVQSGSGGDYSASLTTNAAPQQVCVRATTRLRDGSPPVTKDVAMQVRLAGGPVDSARVDFVVSP
jgi:hypothetical protein